MLPVIIMSFGVKLSEKDISFCYRSIQAKIPRFKINPLDGQRYSTIAAANATQSSFTTQVTLKKKMLNSLFLFSYFAFCKMGNT